MLDKGTGFASAKRSQSVQIIIQKTITCEAEFGDKRQLIWEPDLASRGVWAVSYSSGVALQRRKILSADPLQFSKFQFLFTPRVRHEFQEYL